MRLRITHLPRVPNKRTIGRAPIWTVTPLDARARSGRLPAGESLRATKEIIVLGAKLH